MLTRRSALAVACSTALPFPFTAFAQAPKTRRVAMVSNSTNATFEAVLDAMRRQLGGLGYVEGQAIGYEFRHVSNQLERHPEVAAELVRNNVDLIVTAGGPATAAAAKATSIIPIVFSLAAEPVSIGLVASAQRPGGNLTGATNFDAEQAPQQMALLREVMPQLARVAILGEDGLPGADASGMIPLERAYFAAARGAGLQPQLVRIKGPTPDYAAALSAMAKERADVLVALEVPLVLRDSKVIAERATEQKLATLFPASVGDAGALFAFGTSVFDNFALLPPIIDRILKGTPPGEIPVVFNTRRRLVVNTVTAQRVGILVPDAVLSRATRVVR
jgi:putative ABC transport system substrate-binding protein